MAILLHKQSQERTLLRARSLVGRAPACDLRIDSRLVSGEHATLWWHQGVWWIRDLGSRNGTKVGERRLVVGASETIDVGAVLTFGDQSFTLESAAAPEIGAVALDDGTVVNGAGSLLALPEDDEPVATIYQTPDGLWMAEVGDSMVPVTNLEVLEVAGRLWRLQLPHSVDSTMEAQQGPISTMSTRFAFRISRDEEHVELTLHLADGREFLLPDRAHLYALVVLARARVADADLPLAEQGWLDREQLCRMLAMDRKHLNLQLFRARKQLSNAGFEGVGELIERRATTLRFGPTLISLGTFDEKPA